MSTRSVTELPALTLDAGTPAIWRALRASGAVLLKGAATTAAAFDEVTERFATRFRIHQDPTRRRYNAADTTQSVTGGQDAVGLHAERAYLPNRPELLFFCCLTPPSTGGETTLCDGAAIVDALPEADVRRWSAMTLLWRTSLEPAMWRRLSGSDNARDAARWIGDVAAVTEAPTKVATEAEAEKAKAAEERGALGDGVATARGGEAAPRTRHWFDAATDTLFVEHRAPSLESGWISGRRAFANYLLLAAQEEDGPRATQIDGRAVPADLLARAAAAADANTREIAWERGDVVLLDNLRSLHGRRVFAGGARQVLVRMGDARPALREASAASGDRTRPA